MEQALTIFEDRSDILHGAHKTALDLLKALGLSHLDSSLIPKFTVEINSKGVYVTVSSFKDRFDKETSEEVFILKDGDSNDTICSILKTLDVLGLSSVRGICSVKLSVEVGLLARLNLDIEPGVIENYTGLETPFIAIPLGTT